jgi:hypothetical protein
MSTITQTKTRRRRRSADHSSSGTGNDGGGDEEPFPPKLPDAPLYNGYNVFFNPVTQRWWAYTAPSNNAAAHRLYNLVWGSYTDPDVIYLSKGACDYRGGNNLIEYMDRMKGRGYIFVGTAIYHQLYERNDANIVLQKVPANEHERTTRFFHGISHVLERHRLSEFPADMCPVCAEPDAVFSLSNHGAEKFQCQRFRYGDEGFGPIHENGPFQEEMWKRSEDGSYWVQLPNKTPKASDKLVGIHGYGDL